MGENMHYHTVYIGVNYKTPDKTIQWVENVSSTNSESLVVVVDNSASDNPQLKDEVENKALYIDSGDNLGYFNGAAYGLHEIEKEHTFNWVVVSNVDLLLKTTRVDDILDRYKEAGVVAPAIISFDTGFDKNPYRLKRPSKHAVLIKKFAFSNQVFSSIYSLISDFRNSVIRKRHTEVKKCAEGTPIYLPYGAVLFFSKAFFDRGCRIDFPLFLFGEELYVAEQVRSSGLAIVYVPSIEFINYEHASTSKLSNKAVNKRNYDAMKFILKEYY